LGGQHPGFPAADARVPSNGLDHAGTIARQELGIEAGRIEALDDLRRVAPQPIFEGKPDDGAVTAAVPDGRLVAGADRRTAPGLRAQSLDARWSGALEPK